MNAYGWEVAGGLIRDAFDEVLVDCIWGLTGATELWVHYIKKLVGGVDEFSVFLDCRVGRGGVVLSIRHLPMARARPTCYGCIVGSMWIVRSGWLCDKVFCCHLIRILHMHLWHPDSHYPTNE